MQTHYSDRMKQFYLIRSIAGIPYVYNGIDDILNDQKRNQFYYEILKQCKGKRCIDVGSGSGLLAFIALKHGAEHVTCIEQNEEACKHIKIVSKKMGIPTDKIRVIHDEFRSSRFDEYNLGHIDIIFHEIIGGTIWDEMIGNTFDKHLPNIKILPSEYKIEFSSLILKESLYKKLIDYHHQISGHKDFNYESSLYVKLDPGIEISDEYTKYFEKILNSNYYNVVHPFRLVNVNNFYIEGFADILHKKSNHLHTSIININDTDRPETIEFDLPKTNKPFLILFKPSISEGDCVLNFKDTKSFNGYREPCIFPPNSNIDKFSLKISDGEAFFDKFLNEILIRFYDIL